MQLTSAQLTTLKTWLTSGPGAGLQDEEAIAALHALPATPFYVYNSSAPVDAIKNAIAWKKLTSAASIPTLTGTNAADQTALLHFLSKRTACSDLVLNIQTILGLAAGGTLDATRSSLRQGLKDALEAVPSNADGTTQDAGWNNVQPLFARKATVAEKLFASGGGDGSTANLAANLGVGSDGGWVQGNVTAQNINDARAA